MKKETKDEIVLCILLTIFVGAGIILMYQITLGHQQFERAYRGPSFDWREEDTECELMFPSKCLSKHNYITEADVCTKDSLSKEYGSSNGVPLLCSDLAEDCCLTYRILTKYQYDECQNEINEWWVGECNEQ